MQCEIVRGVVRANLSAMSAVHPFALEHADVGAAVDVRAWGSGRHPLVGERFDDGGGGPVASGQRALLLGASPWISRGCGCGGVGLL